MIRISILSAVGLTFLSLYRRSNEENREEHARSSRGVINRLSEPILHAPPPSLRPANLHIQTALSPTEDKSSLRSDCWQRILSEGDPGVLKEALYIVGMGGDLKPEETLRLRDLASPPNRSDIRGMASWALAKAGSNDDAIWLEGQISIGEVPDQLADLIRRLIRERS